MSRSPTGRRGESVWASRNFRLFFVGQLVSNSGTWLQNVAQGVLVLQLTGRSFMVGIASAALFLPVVFLALQGGRLADRFDRRRLLIATQVLAMAASATLAGLAAAGLATVGAVIAVAAALGVQYAVSIPTMFALLPSLVEPEQVGQAIGMNSITYNLARVVGPVLATAAIGALGFGWSFGLNSLSFLALIAALLAVRPRAAGPARREAGSAREAIRFAWRDRRLRLLLGGIASLAFATDPVFTLAPAFVRQVFDRPAAQAGLVVAAFGIGAIAAALSLGPVFRGGRRERRRVVVPAAAVFVGGMVAFAFVPAFWPALALLLAGGGGYLALSTTWTTAIQESVPDELLGRVMGLWTLSFLGMRPVASLIDGALADVASPSVAAVVMVVPLVVVTVFVVSRMRRNPL